MAISDYITCCKCGVKLIYDGDKGNRNWWQERFGKQPEIECPNCTTNLEACVKEFFEKYLNRVEESDSGKMFHPICISCCRAAMLEPLDKLLDRMAELSGAERKIEYELR